MDERKELMRKIYEYDKMAEKNKLKRTLLTILFYAIVNIFISIGICNAFDAAIDFEVVATMLITSIIFAGISFWVNATIFSQLISKGREENEIIKSMEKRLAELDKKI